MKELIEMLRKCGERSCADCPDIEECAGAGYLMLKAAEELEKPRVSEGLDKVIAGLRCCRVNEDDPCEGNCPYDGQPDCVGRLMDDALAWLQEQNRLIAELSDHIPCCDNCEGKTVIGERTDKCVYEIEGFDSVIYCAKRGIANCFGYRKRIEELEAKLKESEPVVHAHWKAVLEPNTVDNYGRPVYHAECSACGCRWSYVRQARTDFKRCRLCGAHMDEEVADE